MQEVSRKVSQIVNALNTDAINDIPNINAQFLTDRGQVLKDLFGRIATTKAGISQKASNRKPIEDFLKQFNAYGNGEWDLDEFARINNISKKSLDILKQYNEELFGQKETVGKIADKEEEIKETVEEKVLSEVSEKQEETIPALETEEKVLDDILEKEKEITKEKEKQEEIAEEIAKKEEEISEIKKPEGELPYMTDEHGKEIKWYRGTRGSSDVGAFESNRFGGATFWTTNPMTAATYGEKEFPQRIYESLQASLKPFIVNAKGKNWNNLPFFGVDDKAESLVGDYFHGIELLKRTGDSDNFEAHLKQLSKEWTNIREALLHKAFGDIDSVKDELLTEKNIFSNKYDWLDSLRFSPD